MDREASQGMGGTPSRQPQCDDCFKYMDQLQRTGADDDGEFHYYHPVLGTELSYKKVDPRFRACARGHIKCLRYAHKAMPPNLTLDICDVASQNGNLECLKFAHERGYHWSWFTSLWTFLNGRIDCLKYLLRNGCPGGMMSVYHIRYWEHPPLEADFMACLEYVSRNEYRWNEYQWNEYTSAYTAGLGFLECLKFLRRKGCRWDAMTCALASRNGHLECLRYLHENGCPWDERTFGSGVIEKLFWQVDPVVPEEDVLKCLQYARENGCRWDVEGPAVMVRRRFMRCLRYLHENGCPWNGRTTEAGASSLEFLVYAHENGCRWGNDTCRIATQHGNLECLRYAHENGARWDGSTTEHAGAVGSLECLRYCHENGCEWRDTCAYTMMMMGEEGENGKNVACLRYALENGCPWGDQGPEYHDLTKDLECLRVALEAGCPFDFTTKRIERSAVPLLYHYGRPLAETCEPLVQRHRREHVRRAWTLIRCGVIWIRLYNEACARVYAPGGVGYVGAEVSFRETVIRGDSFSL